MQMSVKVEVWGDYACFSRPELKVERMSYDVMTPSAARGLLEALYWHPGLKWIIDRIYVLSPIKFSNIRRNEVKSKISANNVLRVMNGGTSPLYINTSDDIQQRAATVLRDVHYVIEAHFEMTEKATPGDNPGKFQDIMRRRLESGQCYHTPCFGVREFPANFRPWEGGEIKTAYPDEETDLGLMLFDLDYTDSENIVPMFFRAKLKNGVLDLRDCEVLR
ncbi:MAG: type I-C CRISPR-associated protein Cas5c [Oscillospiraceae bacterium]